MKFSLSPLLLLLSASVVVVHGMDDAAHDQFCAENGPNSNACGDLYVQGCSWTGNGQNAICAHTHDHVQCEQRVAQSCEDDESCMYTSFKGVKTCEEANRGTGEQWAPCQTTLLYDESWNTTFWQEVMDQGCAAGFQCQATDLDGTTFTTEVAVAGTCQPVECIGKKVPGNCNGNQMYVCYASNWLIRWMQSASLLSVSHTLLHLPILTILIPPTTGTRTRNNARQLPNVSRFATAPVRKRILGSASPLMRMLGAVKAVDINNTMSRTNAPSTDRTGLPGVENSEIISSSFMEPANRSPWITVSRTRWRKRPTGDTGNPRVLMSDMETVAIGPRARYVCDYDCSLVESCGLTHSLSSCLS